MPGFRWSVADHYESYMGRWSRKLAPLFLEWLDAPAGGVWLDVGCGTGTLAEAIASVAKPSQVCGCDASMGFVRFARGRLGKRARFELADALALPFGARRFDAVVSGLVLNFLDDPRAAVAEMIRITRPGAQIGVYVWDYAGEMQLLRNFWDAAVELDPAAVALDEGRRFPICAPAPLAALFSGAGLERVETRALDIETPFRDFEDYWQPFLVAQAPAPAYAMSLSEAKRAELRERVRRRLPGVPDGSIPLRARAWAVRGVRAGTYAKRDEGRG